MPLINPPITAASLGLGNVDNTSDADKPVSTAEQAALDLKDDEANKGAANGYAPLGSDSKVPLLNLPTLGVGDVVGPLLAVNNTVVLFDGVTGKLIKDSGLTLAGTNTGDQTLPTRASLGLATGDSPQFDGLNIGHASDTTLTRVSAGIVAVEGTQLARGTGTASGTNTGDQASIVGITGTKAQFDTAVSDGNILYVGDAPTAHAASHQNGGGDEMSVAGLSGLLADDQTPLDHDIITTHTGFPGGGTTFLRDDGTFAAPPGGAGPTMTAFTKDLGVARRSGTFDITGLSGLTAEKVVSIVQTAAAIASKGNARDESELDQMALTGYVVNATTIRAYWQAPSVVVGTYAFAYSVNG